MQEEIDFIEVRRYAQELKQNWIVTPMDIVNAYKALHPDEKADSLKLIRKYIEFTKNTPMDCQLDYKAILKQKRELLLAIEKEQKKIERLIRKAEQERLKLLKHPEREPMPENTRPVVRAFVERFLMGDLDEE